MDGLKFFLDKKGDKMQHFDQVVSEDKFFFIEEKEESVLYIKGSSLVSYNKSGDSRIPDRCYQVASFSE